MLVRNYNYARLQELDHIPVRLYTEFFCELVQQNYCSVLELTHRSFLDTNTFVTSEQSDMTGQPYNDKIFTFFVRWSA